MSIGNGINKLRREVKMTQEEFAAALGVSQQSVQKWESGKAVPDTERLVAISKQFGVSLDELVLGNGTRAVEEMNRQREIKPQYQNIHQWEYYSANLATEYQQAMEEGLDVEAYADVFASVARLPRSDVQKRLGDILFGVISQAGMRAGYKYDEPSELEAIRKLRKPYEKSLDKVNTKTLRDHIYGAWIGRMCGCMLGTTVECIHTDELIPFLKETGNYPMHRYIYRTDVTDEMLSRYKYGFATRRYADEMNGMPVDDDTNYVIIAQTVIDKYGRDFVPRNVSEVWAESQDKIQYCTAERVSFCNFMNGYEPPVTAIYKNPFREWIGAQIRGDYFGYINPGNPTLAAEMAWRDASISHTKNGIYGEMLIAAMLAAAATTNNIEEIIRVGLSEIPATSRLYEAICDILDMYHSGKDKDYCLGVVHERFDEYTEHGWCHTIANAMIVVTCLLYGGGDFAKSICMAVETGFDTDCNGATIGSILGMANGISSISEYWRRPIGDTLHTTIFGVGTVKISERVDLTMKHVKI